MQDTAIQGVTISECLKPPKPYRNKAFLIKFSNDSNLQSHIRNRPGFLAMKWIERFG